MINPMRAHDLEAWVGDVVNSVCSQGLVEDSRVELKASWIDAEKCARQLAAHANASHGEPILWVFGVDERNASVSGVDPFEFEGWYKQVQSWFDGYAPELITHLNIRIGSQGVVALYFHTATYAPYVVTNSKGGYPEFSVPWRDGTRVRAARRDELLRLLLPIVKEPRLRLASAKLTMNSGPGWSGSTLMQRDTWTFDGLVYITPSDDRRVVIPYSQCSVWITIPGYSTFSYRLPAMFHSLNYHLPKNPEKKTMKFLNNEIDITPPPPRESYTIKCADSELLADGPGSARLVGIGYVPSRQLSTPSADAAIKIEITTAGSERTIVLTTKLRRVQKQFESLLGAEWSS